MMDNTTSPHPQDRTAGPSSPRRVSIQYLSYTESSSPSSQTTTEEESQQPQSLPYTQPSRAAISSTAVSEKETRASVIHSGCSSQGTLVAHSSDEEKSRTVLDGPIQFVNSHTCQTPWGSKAGWAGWMADTVNTKSMVPSLVLQAFATGVLDATTFADFRTFASNQTGNTILLTVSILDTSQALIELTAISLGTFLVCACIFGQLGHFMGIRRRSWLIMTNTLQILALLVAALLLTVAPVHFRIGGADEWLVLALFAGMSGAQVAQARQSGSAELPTAPMTSSYVDLMADKYLFKGFRHPKTGPRNRRLAYISAMILGALLGAGVHRVAGSWEVVVLTIGLKTVVLGLCLIMRGEERAALPESIIAQTA